VKNSTFLSAVIFLGTCCYSFADEERQPNQAAYKPWYTGTLLATSAGNASPGQLFIQPYFNALYRYGDFNNQWKLIPLRHKQVILSEQLLVQWGLTNRLDFTIIPTMITSIQNGQRETLFADLFTSFGLQILRELPGTWVPNFRIAFDFTFPTGKFDRGVTDRLATDFSGTGAVQVGMILAFSKTFTQWAEHPFRLLANFGITGYTDVDVRGESVYGGIPETFGTVNPGAKFLTYFSGEFSLTQKWVLAFETYFGYLARDRFVGTDFGIPFEFDEKMRFQFVPEIEYNFSQNLGLIGGIEWQFLGYNQSGFANLILSLVYAY